MEKRWSRLVVFFQVSLISMKETSDIQIWNVKAFHKKIVDNSLNNFSCKNFGRGSFARPVPLQSSYNEPTLGQQWDSLGSMMFN